MLPPRPEHVHYDKIEGHFRTSISEGRPWLFAQDTFQAELTSIWETDKVPYDALLSWLRNVHLGHVKKRAPIVLRDIAALAQQYVGGGGGGDDDGISVLELAIQINFPPSQLARYLLQELTTLTRPQLSEALQDPAAVLRNTTQILRASYANLDPARLARNVQMAVESDPLYGPAHDRAKHNVGVEYEVVLRHELKKRDIPFETEDDLRDRGTAKTPDVLLTVPIAVRVSGEAGGDKKWHIINWIDSKALFGDEYSHNSAVLPQVQSYVYRFGPGLVIYWFGHAPIDRLRRNDGDIVVVGWDLPPEIMWPTGELMATDAFGRERKDTG